MERILVYGQGGHSKVIQMMISKSSDKVVSLIADDDQEKTNLLVPVKIVQAQKIAAYALEFDRVVVAIGTNAIRKRVAENCKQKNFATIIDSSAVVADDAIIGAGTVIMPMSVINPSVRIGKHCIINTGAIIEHDCLIEDYSHVSPGAVVTGTVKIGTLVHIGANATILPGVIIEDNVTIGAGAVVTKSVKANSVMIGNPAKKIKKKERNRK